MKTEHTKNGGIFFTKGECALIAENEFRERVDTRSWKDGEKKIGLIGLSKCVKDRKCICVILLY